MKKIFTFLSLLALSFQLQAQCTNAPNGQFPLTNFIPSCIGEPYPISEFCTNDNFSVVTVQSSTTYIFSSSVPSDYITITNGNGTIVLGFGTGSVTYGAVANGNIRFYSHASSACNSDGLSRTRYVQCGNVPTSVPNCPFLISPNNVTVSFNPGPTASWFPNNTGAGYNGFKVYVGTTVTNATLNVTTTQTSAVLTGLAPSTTYFWYVVPYNVVGDAVGCSGSALKFTTEAVPTLNCATAVNIAACGGSQTATFTSATGLYNPVISSCGGNTPGEEKLYTFTPAVTGNYSLNVTASSGDFVSYFYKDATAANCSNFGWTCLGSTNVVGSLPAVTLTSGKTYYILLDKQLASAGSQTFSITCPPPAPANNDASGAVNLTVGAGCSGAPYTNVGSFQSAAEPFPNCGGDFFASVWYKFTAPTSGAVRISTDLGTGNTNINTRVGLYSTTDVNTYANFNLITCDDDGGSAIGFGAMSVLYATGLTGGNVYYIQVGNNDNLSAGTFCLAVDELNSSMLASSNVCEDFYQTPVGANEAYTGWVSLLNETSKLVAMVKNDAGGAVNKYKVAQTVRTGTSRFSSAIGAYYLNRNFRITNADVSDVTVKFFYLNTELTQLQAQAPSTTVATMGVAKQTETVPGCYPDLNAANGTITSILQTGNGSVENVRWVTVPVTGFSNFYLYDYGSIVPIKVIAFNGVKQNEQKNYLYWRLNCVGSENNTIIVERSKDAQQFEGIHTLQNLSSEQCNQALDFTDLTPQTGVNFYRLKFIDADGRVNYTQVISLVNGNRAMELMSLAPNPVKQSTKLRLVSNLKSEAQISILNAAGALVNILKVNLVTGENSINLNLSQLAPGVYNIVVSQSNAENQSIKLIKQ